MRKTLIFLLSFAMVVMAAGGVSASSDCERWLADYKRALAEKPTTQKLLAAKHRARAYARRTVRQLTTPANPAPHPVRLASTRPHLTPAQMVKRFDVLCGALPMEPQVLDARMAPDEFISEMSLGGPVEMAGVPEDATLLSEATLPSYDGPGVTGDVPTVGSYVPVYGPVSGGGPTSMPTVLPPAGGSPAPVPPISSVPEPSSLLLLATGGLGVLGVARRRLVSVTA